MLTGDAGRIMDDGTIARLDDETFYVTTTSTGADAVYQWLTWWNAVWTLDARFAQLTGAVAAINVAGPKARELMQRVSDDDFSNEGLGYLDARHVRVAGVPTLALRIGFVGELGYELHLPSPHAEHVWDVLLEQGRDLEAAPFGLEPQRILRLEKGHVIVGQDTDSESNLLEAAMPWIVKNDKQFDWVGKWATQQVAERGLRWMLVGFESPTGAMPVEGGQVVVDGKSVGPRHVGAALGRARQGDRARDRAARARRRRRPIRRPGQRQAGADDGASRAVLRPRRRAAQGMSDALAFLSPSLARDERGFHPVARSAAEPLYRAAGATFEERDGWRVRGLDPGRGRGARARSASPISRTSASSTCRPAPAKAADETCNTVSQASFTYRLSPRRALVFFPETTRAR